MRTRFVQALALMLVLASGAGCDEISARREVQKGNTRFTEARYEAARDHYEKALRRAPQLAIAHHNLGVTYYKLMKRGDGSAENKQVADRAADHLLTYLASFPKEKDAISRLVTEIWIDSVQLDKAVAYWEKEHQADPKDRAILEQLADLAYRAGDWRKAVAWLEKAVAIAATPEGRAASYLSIGRLCFLKMFNNKDTVVGAERIEMADVGIGALQRGLQIQPKNGEIVSTLASLNQQRALASGSRVGFHLDLAAHQNYMRTLNVLREEAKKLAPPAPGAPEIPGGAPGAPTPPSPPGQGT